MYDINMPFCKHTSNSVFGPPGHTLHAMFCLDQQSSRLSSVVALEQARLSLTNTYFSMLLHICDDISGQQAPDFVIYVIHIHTHIRYMSLAAITYVWTCCTS